MKSLLERFTRARNASVLVIFALVLPVLIGASAFGVDVGLFFLEHRALQKAADAATLAAAVDLDHADGIVRRMLASNGREDAGFALVFGRYRENAALQRDERFASGDAAANTVSIEATRRVPTFFARIFGQQSATIGVRSRAAVIPVVSFTLGSRLLSADPTVLDAVLRRSIGAPLGLSVMDYRSLARSEVRTGAFLNELAAANGTASRATVGEVLHRSVPLTTMLSAIAVELGRTGDAAGANVLRRADRNLADADLRVVPAELLGVEESFQTLRLDYPSDALKAKVSILSILSAAITNRSIGDEISLTLGLPGIARADVAAIVGEAEAGARSALVARATESDHTVETAQARLRLRLRSDAAAVLPGAEAELAFELVAAGARATLLSTTCSSDPAKREIRFAVRPGLLRLSLGRSTKHLGDMTVDDVVEPTALVANPAARIEAKGSIALRSSKAVIVTFRGSEIGDGTVKTVRSRNLAESLVITLIGETEIGVRLGSLGLELGLPDAIKRNVRTFLYGLAEPVDAILETVLAAAGIGLGEADLRVDDLVCNHARLVG